MGEELFRNAGHFPNRTNLLDIDPDLATSRQSENRNLSRVGKIEAQVHARLGDGRLATRSVLELHITRRNRQIASEQGPQAPVYCCERTPERL